MAYITEPIIRQVDQYNPDLPWYSKIWGYLTEPNLFVIVIDWKPELPSGTKVLIPAEFQFDGASIPFFLRPFASSFGPLLRAAIIHDYAYKYNYLLDPMGHIIFYNRGQKFFDDLFRDVAHITSNVPWLADAAWLALRGFGKVAWDKHRQDDAHSTTN